MYHQQSGGASGGSGTITTLFAAADNSPLQQTQIHHHHPNNVNLFIEAGSNVVRHELSAYGEKFLESSSAFLQSRSCIFNTQYYFQVNDEYVKNKVKMILFPFLHKGHWIRAREVVGRDFTYKPAIYDINAPDLYIPLMAFGTYVVLSGFFLGTQGKFSPEALGVQLSTAILCWLLQILLLGATLHTLGGGAGIGVGGEVPLLDLVAYGGYTFIAASLIMTARILLCDHLLWAAILWESLCMGVFLVKTMKRILVSELRSGVDYSISNNKRNYLLLMIAISQIPLLLWLGSS
ncbi:OLC1v1035519C1 [Oldenlandia corymbosa var. corymbosa]|uniref:OLC1v1035519C1 n=1 Tax=Oldenlandia corymbosa var. corymbosa TaxID=529605 RepID=A0AAV1CTV7_OLDCO|nr:OLC1v1035519C1 [Oldenlandia corymbosa var. corymbosa]